MTRTPFPAAKAQALLHTLHVAERLKFELRHSCSSTRRQESVAEHCWRATLIAVFITPYLPQHVDCAKVVELLVVHDLCEVYAGDIPIFDALTRAEEKEAAEEQAIARLTAQLPIESAEKLKRLWIEYSQEVTLEAKVAHVVDKLEAQLQHNEAPLDTWNEWEKARVFNGLTSIGQFDSTLSVLRDEIISEAVNKLLSSGEDISRFGTNPIEFVGIGNTPDASSGE